MTQHSKNSEIPLYPVQYKAFPSSTHVLQALQKYSEHFSHDSLEKKSSIEHSVKNTTTAPHTEFVKKKLTTLFSLFLDTIQAHSYNIVKKYMQQYFFFCPACYSMHSIETKEPFCYCTSCASIWNIFSTHKSNLNNVASRSNKEHALQIWFTWQLECLNRFIHNRVHTQDCIIKMTGITVYIETNTSKKNTTKIARVQLQVFPHIVLWTKKQTTTNTLDHILSKENKESTLLLQDVHTINYKDEIPLRTLYLYTTNKKISICSNKKESLLPCLFSLHYLSDISAQQLDRKQQLTLH